MSQYIELVKFLVRVLLNAGELLLALMVAIMFSPFLVIIGLVRLYDWSMSKPKRCGCGSRLKWSGYDEDGKPGGKATCMNESCQINR
jgi:hypothetical protein